MVVSVTLAAPGLRRRAACFFYEGVLLFGVLMLADYLFATLTQQRHALQHRGLGMAFLFVVLGLYFSWFWSRSGQTLAMKTWHIRLVSAAGGRVSQARAMARYLSSWVWFLPPLALVQIVGVSALGVAGTVATLAGYMLVYALLALAHPERQFWHDAWCGTRLIDARTSVRG